jgi:hypothetical protein
MRTTLSAIAFLLFLLTACGPSHVVVQSEAPAPPPPPPPAPAVSYQSFYDELSPYGNWIDYPGYGYVWMPNVGPGFKPYASNGHWVYTDAGWTWASDYNWGWAPFHYGRWFYDNAYGWMWVPGYEWAPAWVSWRSSADYYGWAPIGPGIAVNVAIGSYNPPSNYWCFVPHQYVNSPRVNTYYVNETKNVTIINNTTVINNNITVNNVSNTRISNTTINNNNRTNVYVAGPDPNEVGRYTGSTVRPVPLRESSRPGAVQENNGQLSLYRPQVNPSPQSSSNGSGGTQRIAPSRVQSLREVRPINSTAAQASNSSPVAAENNYNNPNGSRPVNNNPANNGRPAMANGNSTSSPASIPVNGSSTTGNPHPAANGHPPQNSNNNSSVNSSVNTASSTSGVPSNANHPNSQVINKTANNNPQHVNANQGNGSKPNNKQGKPPQKPKTTKPVNPNSNDEKQKQ